MADELYGIAGIAVTAALQQKLRKGAERGKTPETQVNFYKVDGTSMLEDHRVKIQLPESSDISEYMDLILTTKSSIKTMKSIIFPYTPSISFEHKATYSAQNPTHSNFTQNFYQHSSISPITISGKFTVQNDNDGAELVSIMHLLRALTKMKTGKDADAGSPPPVCRLKAYGRYVLGNIPVVITSFKHEMPEGVDYYTIGKQPNRVNHFDYNTVPVMSTITITCTPVYSRNEMQKFNVADFLAGKFNYYSDVKGYL
jgi:hypothetical protein